MKRFLNQIFTRHNNSKRTHNSPHTQPTAEAEKPSLPSKAAKAPRPSKKKNSDKDSPDNWYEQLQKQPLKENVSRFIDLNLDHDLLHGIFDLGFHYCTPIQAQTLPFTLMRSDAIGHSQTGTGKTAAFLITIINALLTQPYQGSRFAGEPRAVVIAPTRELALQIAKDAQALCKYCPLKIATLIGGIDYEKQRQLIEHQIIDIVIATPGRLIDFMYQKALYLDQVEILVLDEADRMLDMGFMPQVKQIVSATPPKECRQTLLFSATFTAEILTLAERWTENAVRVAITPEHVTTKNIQQHFYLVSTDEKRKVLLNTLRQPEVKRAIVFVNRRDETRRLCDFLTKNKVHAAILSGEIAQNARLRTLEGFRSGKIPVLVATDVAGRGIHVDDISHVINFSLPEDPDDYIHRIGRTGRAGSSGIAISFACEDDSFMIPALEALLAEPIQCQRPPAQVLESGA
ncbi:MAG TPA: DEAD/DEAH box helicase [Pseudomonadales bacterium]|nr:DEAD/DEAH box helicase [Pseudomonadales bacterium]